MPFCSMIIFPWENERKWSSIYSHSFLLIPFPSIMCSRFYPIFFKLYMYLCVCLYAFNIRNHCIKSFQAIWEQEQGTKDFFIYSRQTRSKTKNKKRAIWTHAETKATNNKSIILYYHNNVIFSGKFRREFARAFQCMCSKKLFIPANASTRVYSCNIHPPHLQSRRV